MSCPNYSGHFIEYSVLDTQFDTGYPIYGLPNGWVKFVKIFVRISWLYSTVLIWTRLSHLEFCVSLLGWLNAFMYKASQFIHVLADMFWFADEFTCNLYWPSSFLGRVPALTVCRSHQRAAVLEMNMFRMLTCHENTQKGRRNHFLYQCWS